MATDSENEWNPLSRPRFDEILAEEVAGLPPDARKIFDDNSPKLATNPASEIALLTTYNKAAKN